MRSGIPPSTFLASPYGAMGTTSWPCVIIRPKDAAKNQVCAPFHRGYRHLGCVFLASALLCSVWAPAASRRSFPSGKLCAPFQNVFPMGKLSLGASFKPVQLKLAAVWAVVKLELASKQCDLHWGNGAQLHTPANASSQSSCLCFCLWSHIAAILEVIPCL